MQAVHVARPGGRPPNLWACQVAGAIFFYSVTQIPARSELVVGYARQYARRLQRTATLAGRKTSTNQLSVATIFISLKTHTSIRYDTIRDAILTCARKPTWVSFIYRTEPTTKKCKNRKTKRRKQICPEIAVNSLGIHVVNPEEEKGRAAVERIHTMHKH